MIGVTQKKIAILKIFIFSLKVSFKKLFRFKIYLFGNSIYIFFVRFRKSFKFNSRKQKISMEKKRTAIFPLYNIKSYNSNRKTTTNALPGYEEKVAQVIFGKIFFRSILFLSYCLLYLLFSSKLSHVTSLSSSRLQLELCLNFKLTRLSSQQASKAKSGGVSHSHPEKETWQRWK